MQNDGSKTTNNEGIMDLLLIARFLFVKNVYIRSTIFYWEQVLSMQRYYSYCDIVNKSI